MPNVRWGEIQVLVHVSPQHRSGRKFAFLPVSCPKQSLLTFSILTVLSGYFLFGWFFFSSEACEIQALLSYPCVPALHPARLQEGIMICHQGKFTAQQIMPQCFCCPFRSKTFFFNDAASLFSWEQFTADIAIVVITTYIYIVHGMIFASLSF